LVAACIRADITAIIHFKRLYGGGPKPDMVSVGCVGLRLNAFCLQVQQCQPQGKGIGGYFSIS
jgi:hypothetical protein